ncbi:MAG TPA: ABC transporter permease [Thermoanaerobaculia bacterium]|jgi:microcin C transport system permease protein|nr:ABC transporter permease [Thermoanaerobaculia bacterium]
MHGMVSYFVRRLLLVPITFLCITFLVYAIMRLTPGGPIEQARLQMLRAMAEGRAIAPELGGTLELPQEAIDQLKRYYKLDRSIPVGFAIWLGVWPDRERGGKVSGILQGDFGFSYQYSDPVLETIASRLPISIYFGLIGFFSTWLICIPLGVQKALKHRSAFDTITSLAVFIGYSIPGFVAALVLLLLFGTELLGPGWDVLPLGGFRSENWDQMWATGNYWWCIKDQVRHTIIPIVGYVMGGFATMTLLMKNSLLENLGADYVRTSFAKGLPERRVVFVHALRNSLIPISVGIGGEIGLLFAGSFLIERTCNIPGMGLLGFSSLLDRDYPVLMGILVIGVLLQLVGNILSDIVLAVVDPRVRFR